MHLAQVRHHSQVRYTRDAQAESCWLTLLCMTSMQTALVTWLPKSIYAVMYHTHGYFHEANVS